MTNKNVGQGYKFALLHNASNAVGQYLECGNLIIILRYILAVRLGCTSKEKKEKRKPLNWAYLIFFFKLILS